MEREIDREKIIGRVKRALRNKKEHVARVHFQDAKVFYRIGPGGLFLRVTKFRQHNKTVFRVSRREAPLS
jgi:hypothetical protein